MFNEREKTKLKATFIVAFVLMGLLLLSNFCSKMFNKPSGSQSHIDEALAALTASDHFEEIDCLVFVGDLSGGSWASSSSGGYLGKSLPTSMDIFNELKEMAPSSTIVIWREPGTWQDEKLLKPRRIFLSVFSFTPETLTETHRITLIDPAALKQQVSEVGKPIAVHPRSSQKQ